MKHRFRLLAAASLLVSFAALGGPPAADSTKVLIGSWSGKATGPQGGPPTGDIVVSFAREAGGLTGGIVVKAPGGAQYSGQISNITLKDKIFGATVIFKLGEAQLETQVTGPLKGKTIQGTFSVLAKGQKMGEGTFSITKGAAPPPKK
jgi:hypothetical protein